MIRARRVAPDRPRPDGYLSLVLVRQLLVRQLLVRQLLVRQLLAPQLLDCRHAGIPGDLAGMPAGSALSPVTTVSRR